VLTGGGYRTSGNRGANPFSKDTVREILQNRFNLGEMPDGHGGWIPGKHDAVIDAALFQAVQVARQRNANRPRRTHAAARSPWALSGLATRRCGAPMKASGKSNGCRRIESAGRVQGSSCTAPTFCADGVEQQIGDLLSGFAVPDEQREPLIRPWRTARQRNVNAEVDRGRLERKPARLKDLYLEGDLDKATYHGRRAEIEDQTTDAVAMKLADSFADLSQAWEEATPEERNSLARQVLSGVIIENKKR
jgi:site-specific DNA recombinase